MQLKTKIVLCIGALALNILIFSGISVWNITREAANNRKIELINEQLLLLSDLKTQTLEIFNNVRREIIDEKRSTLNFDLNRAVLDLHIIITGLGRTTREEREVEGEHFEKGDWAYGSSMRQLLFDVSDEINSAVRLLGRENSELGRRVLRDTINEDVNDNMIQRIDFAINIEELEREHATQAIKRINHTVKLISYTAAGIGIILTGIALYILLFRLTAGINALERGSRAFQAGDFDEEIKISGKDELANLAESFNRMAREIARRQAILHNQKKQLEKRVKRRTHELTEANGELQRRDELRRQFFADIGHELRTPVTSIRGEAEVTLLNDDAEPEEYKKSLRTIKDISVQLSRLISDIFLIAREQAGILSYQEQNVNLVTIMENIVDQMHSVAEMSGSSLNFKSDLEIAMVKGDAQRLVQMSQVFVTNALHHAGDNITIDIALCERENEWLLHFKDNGKGIPIEDSLVVFQRFQTKNPARDHSNLEQTNTGLGLPVARSIIKSHGGRVWVDTTFTKGAKFCVTLPKSDE